MQRLLIAFVLVVFVCVGSASSSSSSNEIKREARNPFVHDYYFFNMLWGVEDYQRAGVEARGDDGGGPCVPPKRFASRAAASNHSDCNGEGQCVPDGKNGTYVC